MAEPKRFDINKIENFRKNSADKAQTLSYWNAAVEQGKTVKETDEKLASNVDDKQIADLLSRRTDAINRRDRLIKAVENAIKVKYQPQIPEMFSAANKAMQGRLVELQHQCSSIRRVKSGDQGAILRSLEDAEQRLADARVNSAADKSSKNGTSPQKEPQSDNEQKGHNDGHNADDRQEPRNRARSLQIEELSIHSHGDRTKSNKTSVMSKSSSARRVIDLELNALKEQEELQSRLEKLRRNAEQNEIADLQEKLARKAKITEKEIERARVSSSCGSSFRSISPVGIPDDNLSKVSDWMDKTEEAENVAAAINVPSVYQQTSVPAPVITLRSTTGGQCSAQVGDLKPSVRPTISTEAALRGNGRDGTKTVTGAGSQRATAQPEVKFASSKPSMTFSADPNRLPPTFGGIQSGAFQVPQLANTQTQYMPSQGPNILSNARDDYYIRSSLPKLKLAEVSDDPLEWAE